MPTCQAMPQPQVDTHTLKQLAITSNNSMGPMLCVFHVSNATITVHSLFKSAPHIDALLVFPDHQLLKFPHRLNHGQLHPMDTPRGKHFPQHLLGCGVTQVACHPIEVPQHPLAVVTPHCFQKAGCRAHLTGLYMLDLASNAFSVVWASPALQLRGVVLVRHGT